LKESQQFNTDPRLVRAGRIRPCERTEGALTSSFIYSFAEESIPEGSISKKRRWNHHDI